MPMIDIYAAAGTFADVKKLASDAAALVKFEHLGRDAGGMSRQLTRRAATPCSQHQSELRKRASELHRAEAKVLHDLRDGGLMFKSVELDDVKVRVYGPLHHHILNRRDGRDVVAFKRRRVTGTCCRCAIEAVTSRVNVGTSMSASRLM